MIAKLYWRVSVFVLALVPLLHLFWGAINEQLGADPGKALVDSLGSWALLYLLACLSMTPLRKITGWAGWQLVRRQLGLWSFTAGCLHVLAYLFFLLGWQWGALSAELVQRPYIAVGALAWMLLLLLALTSTRASQRWLGKNWRRLHRTIYLILPLVLLHMLWVVRADWGEWLAYALVGGLLLILRIPAVAMSLRLMRDVWK